jgi:hypothetical protein
VPVLELRRYEITAGRRADFDRRTRDVGLPLFRRLGFRPHGFWESCDRLETVFYALTWADTDEMTERWTSSGATAEWQQARADYDTPVPLLASIERQVLRPAIAGPMVRLVTGPAVVWDWEQE